MQCVKAIKTSSRARHIRSRGRPTDRSGYHSKFFFYEVGKMSFGAVFAVSIVVHLYSAEGKFSF